MAALQADRHREGEGERSDAAKSQGRKSASGFAHILSLSSAEGGQRHPTVEEGLFGAPLPFAVPLQGQAGGRAPWSYPGQHG